MQASPAGLPRSPYDYNHHHHASQQPYQYQSGPQTHRQQHTMPTDYSGAPASSSAYATGGYYAEERASEDDLYGGIDDYYNEAQTYSYYDEEPSPPAPVTSSSRTPSGYTSSTPPSNSNSKASPSSSQYSYPDPSSPPLQPPQLRHPSLRSSAASSYSSNSSSSKGQLGADLAARHHSSSVSDQRSTWRSDVTSADAFAFRDYESPAPPRVVITAPMTPPTRRMSEVQEERWRDSHGRGQQEVVDDMTVSPLRIREKELEPEVGYQHGDMQEEEQPNMTPSPSGKSRSMYNAANFSRPLRSTSPEESTSPPPPSTQPTPSTSHSNPPISHSNPSTSNPIPRPRPKIQTDTEFRPDSIASVYSTASTLPPISLRSRTDSTSTTQPLSILRTSAAYAESNRVLPPISPTSGNFPVEQPPAQTQPQQQGGQQRQQQSGQQVVNRKPSIRFQDPRPPPPPPPVPQIQVSMQRSVTAPSSAPNRALIMDQARNRPAPPPPAQGQYNNSANGRNAGGPPPMNNSLAPRSGSPAGDSVYSNYSYYDPEAVRGSAPPSPSPGHNQQPSSKGPSPLAKSASAPAGNSTSPRKHHHRGEESQVPAEPRTAEDYLQLGIQHHLDGDLVESAYCFEISAKGVGALRRANAAVGSRSSHSTSDDHHSGKAGGGDARYAVGGEEGGCGVGMLMWGLALRSGWGVGKDEKRGFKWLRRAAEHAVEDLESVKSGAGKGVGGLTGAVQTELVLAIYEVGQCFFQGWGVKKDQAMAVSYFQVAAKLGDPDAQQELAFCLLNGRGCKKNKKEAARWYRAAVAQGASDVGLAWIFKDKYM